MKHGIREFALRKPVHRLMVNAPASQGAVGYATSLVPSMVLGCGTPGNNITSDNVGPLNLINIKRVSWARPEFEEEIGVAPPEDYERRPLTDEASPGMTWPPPTVPPPPASAPSGYGSPVGAGVAVEPVAASVQGSPGEISEPPSRPTASVQEPVLGPKEIEAIIQRKLGPRSTGKQR